MTIRFRETRLIRNGRNLTLLDYCGNMLLELNDREVDHAVRAGFLDSRDLHFSMYAYARLMGELHEVEPDPGASRHCRVEEAESGRVVREGIDEEDREILAGLGIRWE